CAERADVTAEELMPSLEEHQSVVEVDHEATNVQKQCTDPGYENAEILAGFDRLTICDIDDLARVDRVTDGRSIHGVVQPITTPEVLDDSHRVSGTIEQQVAGPRGRVLVPDLKSAAVDDRHVVRHRALDRHRLARGRRGRTHDDGKRTYRHGDHEDS